MFLFSFCSPNFIATTYFNKNVLLFTDFLAVSNSPTTSSLQNGNSIVMEVHFRGQNWLKKLIYMKGKWKFRLHQLHQLDGNIPSMKSNKLPTIAKCLNEIWHLSNPFLTLNVPTEKTSSRCKRYQCISSPYWL